MRQWPLANLRPQIDEVRICAAGDDRVIQRPARDRLGLVIVDCQVERRPFADHELRVEDAMHLLLYVPALDGGDETQVADVDAQNRDPRTLEPVCRLQQRAVSPARNNQVRGTRRRGVY